MTKTAKTSTSSCRTAPPNEDGPAPKRAKKSASPCGGQGENPTSEPAGLSWADLGPELVSLVARYVSPDTADMMNFLFCVGPKVATIVRTTYLTGNDEYLRMCMHETPPYSNRGFEKRRTRVLTWMEYNDWKERCVLSQKHVVNVCFKKDFISKLFLFLDIPGGLVYVGPSNKESKEISRRKSQLFKSRSFRRAFRSYGRVLKGLTVILGIGGTKIKYGTTAKEVRAIFDKATPNREGKIDLKIGRFIDIAFSYPRVFIGLGLDSVLKYHLDEGTLKPNSTVEGSAINTTKGDVPLLWQAIQEPGGFCFRYLLGLSDVHVAGRNDDAMVHGFHLLHVAAGYMKGKWVREHLGLLLDHPLVDPNVVSGNGRTALHCICFSGKLDQEDKIERIRLLLEKGADPYIEDDGGFTLMDDLYFSIHIGQYTESEKGQFRELMHELES